MRWIATLLLAWAAPLWAQPARLVSTAPSITETLYALGLGPRVVGVTVYCRYPAEARALPKVGTFLDPNFERILALKPDVVFTIKNPVRLTERLRELKLNAVELNQETIAGVLQSIGQIGEAADVPTPASDLRRSLESELRAIRATTADKPQPSVLFIIGRTPGTLEGLIGAGAGTYLDELLSYAGGRNVLASSTAPYPKVSLEQLLSANPDVILDIGDFAHADGVAREKQQEVVKLWSRYPKLAAVRNRRVHALGSDVFVVPGPRMTLAAREFLRLLHPELKP